MCPDLIYPTAEEACPKILLRPEVLQNRNNSPLQFRPLQLKRTTRLNHKVDPFQLPPKRTGATWHVKGSSSLNSNAALLQLHKNRPGRPASDGLI